MVLLIDEAYLPATLSAPPMTDEEFVQFCADNPDYFIEMTADGEILLMLPTYTLTAFQGSEVHGQLTIWNLHAGRPGNVSGADAGFVLPNGARRSPDVSWVSRQRQRDFGPVGPARFLHGVPEFVIEVRSHTDSPGITLEAGSPVDGFVLDLGPVWEPAAS